MSQAGDWQNHFVPGTLKTSHPPCWTPTVQTDSPEKFHPVGYLRPSLEAHYCSRVLLAGPWGHKSLKIRGLGEHTCFSWWGF